MIREAVTDGDSLVRPASPTTVLREAAAKLKRDTTTMDSLELAIYKHNKAVDDSLALDSINRSRKSGIDSPVEYSANDSLTYNAINSQARLYGSSKVKYQNMDLVFGISIMIGVLFLIRFIILSFRLLLFFKDDNL